MAGPAFQAGMAIGEFGGSVADLFVATPVAAAHPPSIGATPITITFDLSSVIGTYKLVLSIPVLQGLVAEHGIVIQGLDSLYAAMGAGGGLPEEPPEGMEVTRRHRAGNQRVTKGDQTWNLPEGIGYDDIPDADPVGNVLQEAATEIAQTYSRDQLTGVQVEAIERAERVGDFGEAARRERMFKGTWIQN